MTDQKTTRYYLFSLSNLMAAVGGGMILGKGVNAINIPFLQGSSLLAFFVGTVFGLGFLQLTPEKFSKIFTRWFSIAGGITSIILCLIFWSYAVNEQISGTIAVVFFLLLSLRFGFWFYSRVLRAAASAGQRQNIAWVELGYYSGVIVGLVLWVFLGFEIGMAAALLVDSFLQVSAGCLDLFANRNLFNKPDDTKRENNQKKITAHKNIWGWRLALAAMFMTVGVQVVIFNLAHQVSSQFSPYILAFFYLGSAVSAFICKKLNIRLEWKKISSRSLGYAVIFAGSTENKKKISFLWGSILSALSVAMVVLNVVYLRSESFSIFGFKEFWLLFFVFIATFLYGILELAVLDRIGIEEKNSAHRGMILHTYGIMSIAAVFGLWILEITHSSLPGLFFTLSVCFVLTVLAVRKRSAEYGHM